MTLSFPLDPKYSTTKGLKGVVECLTRDKKVAGSIFTGITCVVSFSRHINACLLLVQPRKTRPDITEKNVDWDVKNKIKQTNNRAAHAACGLLLLVT